MKSDIDDWEEELESLQAKITSDGVGFAREYRQKVVDRISFLEGKIKRKRDDDLNKNTINHLNSTHVLNKGILLINILLLVCQILGVFINFWRLE